MSEDCTDAACLLEAFQRGYSDERYIQLGYIYTCVCNQMLGVQSLSQILRVTVFSYLDDSELI